MRGITLILLFTAPKITFKLTFTTQDITFKLVFNTKEMMFTLQSPHIYNGINLTEITSIVALNTHNITVIEY